MKQAHIYGLAGIVIIIAIIGLIYMANASSSAQVVTNGDNISVFYTGTLTNGTVFDSNVGGQALSFTVGTGQVIQGFDQGVLGMKVNQTKTITIPANEAYSPVNPNMIIQVPLKQFGNQSIQVGMTVTQTSSDGQQFQGTVTALNAMNATVDFNPKLAGQTLIFRITIVSIKKGG